MRVCAGLTSHEVEESCKAATSLHFVVQAQQKVDQLTSAFNKLNI